MSARCKQLTADITLHGEKLRSGNRQRCLLSPLVFSTAPEVLANAIRQKKKVYRLRRKKVLKTLFADDMLFYVENSKERAKQKPKQTPPGTNVQL